MADDLGRVDIVVANAGIGGEQKPTAEYSDASWHKVIGVNLDGVFYTQRAGIQAMRRNGGGSVINMASDPGPGRLRYVQRVRRGQARVCWA